MMNNIAHWPKRVKMIVLGAWITLFSTLSYAVIVNPVLHEKNRTQQKIGTLKQQIQQQQQMIDNHSQQQPQQDELQQEYIAAKNLTIAPQQISNWLGFLAQLAQQNHLTLLSSQALTPIDANFYQELPLQLRLAGSYQNITAFLTQLASLKPLFLIANFSLSFNNADLSHQNTNSDPLLLNLQLHAFSANKTNSDTQSELPITFIAPEIKSTSVSLAHDPFSTAVITITPAPENKDLIDLNFQDVSVRSVLQMLAEFAHINIIVNDKVQGHISLHLQHSTWQECLQIILQTQGLGQRQIGKSILVAPLPELIIYDKQQLQIQQELNNSQALQTSTFQLKYGKAQTYYDTLKIASNSLLSPRGKIMVNPRTNFLLVEDLSNNIKRIRHYIEQTDIPLRQVEIEARIVTIDKAYEEQLGIKWNVQGSSIVTPSGSADRAFNIDLGAGAIEGTQPGNIALATLANDVLIGLELSALEAEGNGEVLSSPRLLTADQQEAVIEQGQEIPYQEVASATTGATTTSFKQAVLRLKVTPQIINDKQLLLHLHVNQDAKSRDISKGGVPLIDTRQITTNILIKNGETVVLGGIYERNKSDTITRIPFLSDIPLVGNLFKHRMIRDNRKELLIFVTPRIVTQ